jgi:lauroyl/myristoyl acyltransferase
VPRTDDHAADAVAGTAALQAQFEAFIRQAPEQWMWAHRKWVADPACGHGSPTGRVGRSISANKRA